MPRAKSDDRKSSEELDAEIAQLMETLKVKRKVRDAAKRREDAAAEQARTIAEAQFNKDFVEKAQEVYLSDYEDEGQTVYEIIKALIRPSVSPEPEQAVSEPEQDFGPLGDDDDQVLDVTAEYTV